MGHLKDVIRAVEGGLSLSDLAPRWAQHCEVVAEAVNRDIDEFDYVPEHLRNDHKFMSSVIESNAEYELLTYVTDLNTLAQIVFDAYYPGVHGNDEMLIYINDRLDISPAIVPLLLKIHYSKYPIDTDNIKGNVSHMCDTLYILENLQCFNDNRELYLQILPTNGYLIQTASETLRADFEIAMCAIKGASIRGKELIAYPNVADNVYDYLSKQLQSNYEILASAMFHNVMTFEGLPEYTSNIILYDRLFRYLIWPDNLDTMGILGNWLDDYSTCDCDIEQQWRADARLMRFTWAKNPELVTWFDFTCDDVFNAYHALALNTAHANMRFYW